MNFSRFSGFWALLVSANLLAMLPLAADAEIPPIDAIRVEPFETATFSLG